MMIEDNGPTERTQCLALRLQTREIATRYVHLAARALCVRRGHVMRLMTSSRREPRGFASAEAPVGGDARTSDPPPNHFGRTFVSRTLALAGTHFNASLM